MAEELEEEFQVAYEEAAMIPVSEE